MNEFKDFKGQPVRMIRTLEELKRLGPASVIKDHYGFVYEREIRGGAFHLMNDEGLHRPESVRLPAMVLWEARP